MKPFSMETAPKDGTWLKLLVDYSGHDATFPMEDSNKPSWTLGFNNFDHDENDEWIFVGWDWGHDCIVETRIGKPVGWAYFIEPELTADFTQSLPGGRLDDSTYEKIEAALDRINAPATSEDDKWLSLHERVGALRENIVEIASETAPNWETRCRRIIAVLGLDLGDPAEYLPDSISDQMLNAAMKAFTPDYIGSRSHTKVEHAAREAMREAIDAALRVGRNQKFPLKP